MKLFFISFFLISYSFVSKASDPRQQDSSKWSIEFKKEQIIDKNLTLKGLPVGGLSGLAYDSSTHLFYALSDAKKNHRLYSLKLKKQPDYHFEILDSLLLKEPDKTPLKRNMDPEELVFYNKDRVFISSEGQQVYKEHEPTQIFSFNLPDFNLKEAWDVPEMFWTPGQKTQDKEIGQQSNKGFEALALDKKSNTLWAGTEAPLYQDLRTRNQALIRLSEFDIKSKKLASQFLYPISEGFGLTAMLFLQTQEFLTLERKFDGVFFTVALFETNCKGADDVKHQITLRKKSYKFCSKKQLWHSKSLDFLVDNLEGMAFFDLDSSDKKLLILMSDNNFKIFQKNQFLFFEISQ